MTKIKGSIITTYNYCLQFYPTINKDLFMKCNTVKMTYSEGPTWYLIVKGLLSLQDIACSFILNNNASDSFWHFWQLDFYIASINFTVNIWSTVYLISDYLAQYLFNTVLSTAAWRLTETEPTYLGPHIIWVIQP